jgi:hypothetical protein
MKLSELQELLKLHNIKGFSHMNKPEIMVILKEKGIDTSDDNSIILPMKKTVKSCSLTPDKLFGEVQNSSIPRKQPRQVEILDRDTGEVVKYPSIYKAARAYKQCSTMIAYYNGRVWKDRYEIKVY